MERAGRVEDALELYRAALVVVPDDLQAIQGLASLTMHTGHRDDLRLQGWLETIAMRGRQEWGVWARQRLSSGRFRR